MKQSIFTIRENLPLTDTTWKMVLEGDTSAIKCAGQFVDLKLDGHFLRRPFSICDWTDTTLTVDEARAESWRIVPGISDYYTFGDYRLRLHADENGILRSVFLTR